jgi:hypothetical protein
MFLAELGHESQNRNVPHLTGNDPEGVKFPYKKQHNRNHNPVGVEFQKNNIKQITKPIRA